MMASRLLFSQKYDSICWVSAHWCYTDGQRGFAFDVLQNQTLVHTHGVDSGHREYVPDQTPHIVAARFGETFSETQLMSYLF